METFDKNLAAKARELRNAYSRNWYKNHPGKKAEYTKRYWLKKAAKSLNISS